MSEKFSELVDVMARLRAPGGCPWDREQTYESLAQYLLEETYEAYDAIQEAAQTGNTDNLRDELGDVLLQVVFHSTIGSEKGDFTIDDVAEGVTQKLVLRHPHVFSDKKLETADDVLENWDELKKAEREARGKRPETNGSLLDEIPKAFPALIEADKVTKKKRPKWALTGRMPTRSLQRLTKRLANSSQPCGTKTKVILRKRSGTCSLRS